MTGKFVEIVKSKLPESYAAYKNDYIKYSLNNIVASKSAGWFVC